MTAIDVGSASAAFDLDLVPADIAEARRILWAAQVRTTLRQIAARMPAPRARPIACVFCGIAGGAHWGDCPIRELFDRPPEERQIQRIKTSHKSKGIKPIAHSEWRAPRKATLPARNLRLPDGRLLVYQGPVSMNGSAAGWWFTADAFKVCATVDATRFGRMLHLSMSYPDHDPDWEDILQVRYTFYPPDIDIMMVLPRDGDYVNIHQHTFQIRPTPEVWNDAAPLSTKELKVGTGNKGKAQATNTGKAVAPRDLGPAAGRRK